MIFLDLPRTVDGHDLLLDGSRLFLQLCQHIIPVQLSITAAKTEDIMVSEVIRIHDIPTSTASDRHASFTRAP